MTFTFEGAFKELIYKFLGGIGRKASHGLFPRSYKVNNLEYKFNTAIFSPYFLSQNFNDGTLHNQVFFVIHIYQLALTPGSGMEREPGTH